MKAREFIKNSGCAIHRKEYRIMMYLPNQISWQEEYTALRECITLGIPTICLIDTNCNFCINIVVERILHCVLTSNNGYDARQVKGSFIID